MPNNHIIPQMPDRMPPCPHCELLAQKMCDQCGTPDIRMRLTKCPTCDFEICDNCQHLCYRYKCKRCAKPFTEQQIQDRNQYCSINCANKFRYGYY